MTAIFQTINIPSSQSEMFGENSIKKKIFFLSDINDTSCEQRTL